MRDDEKRRGARRRRAVPIAVLVLGVCVAVAVGLPQAVWAQSRTPDADRSAARDACPPTSEICLENSLPGNPYSEWNVPGAGSTHIQGYPVQMSVNKGETAQFK